MNKLWTIVTLALATNSSFAAAEKAANKPQQAEKKPAIVLQIFDTSTKISRPIKGNKLSISKKQNQLCWNAVNLTLPTNEVTIAEAFYAPAPMNLLANGSTLESSADKKSHTVITKSKVQLNQVVGRCWGFDSTDPIGKYKLDVQINNIIFKDLAFEIVK